MAKDWHSSRAWKSPAIPCWLWLASIAAAAATMLPFASREMELDATVRVGLLAFVVLADLLTATLLFLQHASRRQSQLYALASGYAISGLLAFLCAAATPGLLTDDGWNLIPVWISSWTSTLWLASIPIATATAFVVGPIIDRLSLSPRREALSAVVASLLCLATAGAISLVVGIAGDVSTGPYTSPTADTPNPSLTAIVVLGCAALAYSCYFVRRSRSVERWTAPASGAAVTAALMSALAGDPRAAIVHASLIFALLAPAFVLIPLLGEVGRLFRSSENERRVLEDEALRLLRETRTIQMREDRLRRVLDTAADGYMELDSTGVITTCNDRLVSLFSLPSRPRPGAIAVASLFDPSSLELLASTLEVICHPDASDDESRIEMSAVDADGTSFPVELTMWSHDTQDGRRVHIFVRDITLRRQFEGKMQKALDDERRLVQKLQEIDRTKTDFVSSVSHELRSPLTSTLGYLELLSDDVAGSLNPEQRHMVEVAERNGRRLLMMIEDLLTLSRIETGAFNVRFKPLEIAPLLSRTLTEWQSVASMQSLDLSYELEDDDLGLLPGDEHQIVKALGNILGNAVKFTPRGGKIDVAVRRRDGALAISVTDSGIGIPLDEQSQLFRRFFRSSTAVEQAYSGTGLGLTIARAIIEHHGGSIQITSSTSSGTRVDIELPSVSASSPTKERLA